MAVLPYAGPRPVHCPEDSRPLVKSPKRRLIPASDTRRRTPVGALPWSFERTGRWQQWQFVRVSRSASCECCHEFHSQREPHKWGFFSKFSMWGGEFQHLLPKNQEERGKKQGDEHQSVKMSRVCRHQFSGSSGVPRHDGRHWSLQLVQPLLQRQEDPLSGPRKTHLSEDLKLALREDLLPHSQICPIISIWASDGIPGNA